MSDFRFGAASFDETYVYGAQRPGYPASRAISDDAVARWSQYMRQRGVKRVCCLLQDQLACYDSDLLAAYRRFFGEEALCWAPIKDFTLADNTLLTATILPFLDNSVRKREPVVVHCSGGIGRTGHVLAAWLVYARNMTNEQALSTVIAMGRNPYEAEGQEPAGKSKLNALLDECRDATSRSLHN
jgi:protein-tyrosine phosphatase